MVKSTGEALRQEITQKLLKVTENAAFEADELCALAWQVEKNRLPQMAEKPLTFSEVRRAKALLRRRLGGEPLQYIIGSWDFYNITLQVGRGVLIPRPDTETLVECALNVAKEHKNPVIIDLCTGTGAVAISLAKNCAGATVTAVEQSKKALDYCKNNVKLNAVAVEVVADDAMYWHPEPTRLADLVTCNPPYIKRADLKNLQKEVKFEPKMALDGGQDGLDFYRAIILNGYRLLKPKGTMLFEVGFDQAEMVKKLFEIAGYQKIKIYKDLNGIERVVTAQIPKE